LIESEDCIECQVSDGYSHLRVNLLIIKSKVISNIVSLISDEDEEFITYLPSTDRQVCELLLDMISVFASKVTYYQNLSYYYLDKNKILSNIYSLIAFSYGGMIGICWNTGILLDCWD
jgi:hypothetical protein